MLKMPHSTDVTHEQARDYGSLLLVTWLLSSQQHLVLSQEFMWCRSGTSSEADLQF